MADHVNGDRWSEADKAELIRLDEGGMPIADLAQHFGISPKAVHQMRHRLGLTKTRQAVNVMALLENTVRICGKNSQTGFTAYRSLTYSTAGLASEVGELMGEYKKIFRNDGGTLTPERRARMLDELGDILWYVQSTIICLKADIADVIRANNEKLMARLEQDTINERTPGQ